MSLFESMTHVPVPFIIEMIMIMNIMQQGGRTWQPFVGGKNGHETFRQARIYNLQLRLLSRSLSDCKSLTLNVMIQVLQFVRNSQLCH